MAGMESERKLCPAISKQMPCQKSTNEQKQLLFGLLLTLARASGRLLLVGDRGGSIPQDLAPLAAVAQQICLVRVSWLEKEKPQKSTGTA